MIATVATYCTPSRSDLLDAVEQESKRVEAHQFAAKFPLLGDLAFDLSEEFKSSMRTLDSPLFAKKQYWCLDKDWAARRQSLLLDALKRVCGSTQNETDLQASARLLNFYGVLH
jgi:hypothetical protein